MSRLRECRLLPSVDFSLIKFHRKTFSSDHGFLSVLSYTYCNMLKLLIKITYVLGCCTQGVTLRRILFPFFLLFSLPEPKSSPQAHTALDTQTEGPSDIVNAYRSFNVLSDKLLALDALKSRQASERSLQASRPPSDTAKSILIRSGLSFEQHGPAWPSGTACHS